MAGLPFTETQETFDTTGQRESLSDLIYNISPTETPYLMMAGRGSASATLEEWQMDQLAAAGDNAAVEGLLVESADIDKAVPTVRMANHTQISDKNISITGTIEVTSKAGRASELSYQLAKRAKELKRDLEHTMVGQATVALMVSSEGTGAGATPRRSGAVQSFFHADWTTTNTTLLGIHISRGTGGADGGFIEATKLLVAPTDAAAADQRALLESDLKGVIQGAWTNGGDPSVVMAGPFNKTVISGFSGNSTRFDRGEDKRLVASIDVYVSDFGEHRIVPNRFQRERDVFVFTPELHSVKYLRPFRQHALAKVGDSEDRTLLVEWTLCVQNHAGDGIVADLTTA